MKAAFITVCLLLVAVPCQADTFLALSSAPSASLHWESEKVGLELGLDVSYYTATQGIDLSGNEQDLSILDFSPVLTGQWFLNEDHKAQSFLELSVRKGLPIVTGSNVDYLKQFYDDWAFGTGAGLRSAVADRLNLGGAAGLGLTLRTLHHQSNHVTAGTSFRVFLQYRL